MMILITDAHIDAPSGPDFFRMLKALEKTREPVVFLGDIFDLWIALPGYEDGSHRTFLEWCHREKRRRTIGFMEGNHEFFVSQRRKDAFSWCTDAAFRTDGEGRVFCHGDRINFRDKNYRRFRALIRNPWACALLRGIPRGPALSQAVKRASRKTNRKMRGILPAAEIEAFARSRFEAGARRIFVGHFHQSRTMTAEGGQTCHLLPAWCDGGRVTRYDEENGRVFHLPWPSL